MAQVAALPARLRKGLGAHAGVASSREGGPRCARWMFADCSQEAEAGLPLYPLEFLTPVPAASLDLT